MTRRATSLAGPGEAGFQTGERYPGSGLIRSHAFGCRSDGGTGLPPGACAKCAQGADEIVHELMVRLDRFAGAGR